VKDPAAISAQLQEALDALDIPARAIVAPTPWDVGPVACFLFPGPPVTLIDSGVDTPEGVKALQTGLATEGLEPADVQCVIVTHMHTDHFGGARWLQASVPCQVLLHPADIALMGDFGNDDATFELFRPLGFDDDEIRAFMQDFDWRPPMFAELDRDRYEIGDSALLIEHHPGHTPGHVWAIHEATGAIFVGDYVIGDHPTNAGMELDRSHPTGRAPLLQQYNAGLAELREREAPMLFPAHGPPIADHRDLIDRRLAKSDRRTRHVLDGVKRLPNGTALEIGRLLWGKRPEENWEVLADLVGRLDLLVADGRARSRMGEDGAVHFEATDPGE
jgi:glyoxylase-like metal-dependent hydrolase (beta-lactamase superfamily II)